MLCELQEKVPLEFPLAEVAVVSWPPQGSYQAISINMEVVEKRQEWMIYEHTCETFTENFLF